MIRVLVVGGYGGFGGRLSQRLASLGFDVIVAGRSFTRASAFCRDRPGCRPLQADRTAGLASVLKTEQPNLVIDASGPFQAADYRLVRECVAARISYLDLADARQFVSDIPQFDQTARRAGVTVVSGASSVPALSAAVTRRLAKDLERVTAVEIAISASSRASVGPSVAEAIVGNAGQPMMLWRGARWIRRHGWQELRREDFCVPGGPTLRNRLVALADVPDLALLPTILPGGPAVTFRGGTESRTAMIALWMASWPVRWGWVRSLRRVSRPLARLSRFGLPWGSDRSGMTVRVFGKAGTRRVERRWTLVAEVGDGPEIPTLAAVLLAQRIALGALQPGAYSSVDLLELDDFEPLFQSLSIKQAIEEIRQPPALYQRVMGDNFETLPEAVQAMHDVLRDAGAQGAAIVERGSNPIARLVGRLMGFPGAGNHSVHVHFAEVAGVERWTRAFGKTHFSSRLSAVGGELVERFGPLRFHFALIGSSVGLEMRLRRWSLMKIPLPLVLGPRSDAREWEEGGRFQFDVPISLPLVGLVVRYRGWLAPGPAAATDQKGTSSSRSVSKAAGWGRCAGRAEVPPPAKSSPNSSL